MGKASVGLSKRLSVKRVPIKKFEQTRWWDKRPFKFIERNLLIGDARRTAKTLRFKANYVRVVHTKLGYEIWACPKWKRPR